MATHRVDIMVSVTMDEMEDRNPETSALIAMDIVGDLIHTHWDADADITCYQAFTV